MQRCIASADIRWPGEPGRRTIRLVLSVVDSHPHMVVNGSPNLPRVASRDCALECPSVRAARCRGTVGHEASGLKTPPACGEGVERNRGRGVNACASLCNQSQDVSNIIAFASIAF